MQTRSVHIGYGVVIPLAEIEFQTSRSSGPGGQNVNKLETRIELFFDIKNSPHLSPEFKSRLLSKQNAQIDSDGVLRIACQESRSQWQNKQIALERFQQFLKKALTVPRPRRATRPTKSSHEKRLSSKRIHSDKKKLRKSSMSE
jgi:ribosome-associated protein